MIVHYQANGDPTDVPVAKSVTKPPTTPDVPTDLSPDLAALFATLNQLHKRAVDAINAHMNNTGDTSGRVAQVGGGDAGTNPSNPKAGFSQDSECDCEDEEDDDEKEDEEKDEEDDDDAEKDNDDEDNEDDEDEDYDIGADANGDLWLIAKRDDVSPDEGSKKYGDVPFADEKNKKYPIDAEHVQAAWSYINKPENAGKYSSDDLAKIKGKIKAAMKEHGHEVSEENSGKLDPLAEFGGPGSGRHSGEGKTEPEPNTHNVLQVHGWNHTGSAMGYHSYEHPTQPNHNITTDNGGAWIHAANSSSQIGRGGGPRSLASHLNQIGTKATK